MPTQAFFGRVGPYAAMLFLFSLVAWGLGRTNHTHRQLFRCLKWCNMNKFQLPASVYTKPTRWLHATSPPMPSRRGTEECNATGPSCAERTEPTAATALRIASTSASKSSDGRNDWSYVIYVVSKQKIKVPKIGLTLFYIIQKKIRCSIHWRSPIYGKPLN